MITYRSGGFEVESCILSLQQRRCRQGIDLQNDCAPLCERHYRLTVIYLGPPCAFWGHRVRLMFLCVPLPATSLPPRCLAELRAQFSVEQLLYRCLLQLVQLVACLLMTLHALCKQLQYKWINQLHCIPHPFSCSAFVAACRIVRSIVRSVTNQPLGPKRCRLRRRSTCRRSITSLLTGQSTLSW